MSDVNPTLALAGVLLFALGLFNGFVIPIGRSPRLGLSAHLTAVQSGTFLIAMSLLWPHIGFRDGRGEATGLVLWVSLYAIWLSLLFAGLLGAGRGLPIAGGEARTKPIYQRAVSTLLIAGTVGTTLATGAIAWQMLVSWGTHT